MFLIPDPTHSPSLHLLCLCLAAHSLFECLALFGSLQIYFKLQTYFLVFNILFKSMHKQKAWAWKQNSVQGIGKKRGRETLVRISTSSEVQKSSLPKTVMVRAW